MTFGATLRDRALDRGARTGAEPVWRRTPTAVLGTVAGVVVLGAGLLAGRADVAAFGVPLLLSGTWSGRPGAPRGDAPDRPTAATVVSPEEPTAPGEIRATVRLDPPSGAGLVVLRAAAPGHESTDLVVAADRAEIVLRSATVRTGPQPTFVVDLRGYGPGGTTAEDPVRAAGATRLVLPTAVPLGRVPLPPRMRGLTGPHTSRRLGAGDELRDVHPFTPGDRLRRIDWRTTARRSPDLDELSVRRTYATAEATTMLVVDSRDDVGPDLRTWRGQGEQRVDEATSLDLARQAAASVARAVVDAGDRVGLQDLGRRRRPLPPAAGRRHLRRILHGLAMTSPLGSPARRLRPPQLPADAVVFLFSTVLDDEPVVLARTWREQGHRVVLVDTLPALRPVTEPHMQIAWRVTSMEREDRLRQLVAEGTPVVPWRATERTRAAARFEALVKASERHHSAHVHRAQVAGGAV
ncbi:DUF58 domain-containing protein [Isoptericola sp. 178]|uniref:DUF58 domain-containing protein n=1 Tax=Isoptericola sp. 178 TaxID=3064651 RepID=UPI0027122147|nr:DUF58 domain-containing protein [Isoptericola sp. 178]MDO8144849.1 DUF58 domain-containing protein [Isoptericola sp. 178]